MRNSGSHLNGDLLCAMDVETTGLRPGYHDVYEIAIIPLDHNYRPDRKYKYLDISIMPDYPDRIDWGGISQCGNKTRLQKVMESGLTYDAALQIINRWFASLQLIGKRIAPVTHNGVFDLGHLQHFLGIETYEFMFNQSQVRDTMYLARSMNDLADLRIQNFPYAKVDLRYLCTELGINSEKYGKTHLAFNDALLTAEIYGKLLDNLKLNSTL